MNFESAIRVAESLLPGVGPIEHEGDPRWRALIGIRDTMSEAPESVWSFVRRWGSSSEASLRHAVAVCLLQELLASNFEVYFARVGWLVREDKLFADTFLRCSRYGDSALPDHAEAFDDLQQLARELTDPTAAPGRIRMRASSQGLA